MTLYIILFPDGDTWCITPEKVCADNEEAHLDWNLNWKCEPIMGCMDKYSVHYNPNAVKNCWKFVWWKQIVLSVVKMILLV